MMEFLSIRVSVLGLIFAGLLGSSASADPTPEGPITACSFSPTEQTLTFNDLYESARTDAVFSGSTAYVKSFLNGSLILSRTEDVASGNIPIGLFWDYNRIGETRRYDYYADVESSSAGSPLCSFTVSYVYFPPLTPITECSFDPVSVEVPADGVKQGVSLNVTADGGTYFAEEYVDGDLITFNNGQIYDWEGNFPYPDWNENIAGKTWKVDFYASGADVEDGKSPLCSLTAEYESTGGDSEGPITGCLVTPTGKTVSATDPQATASVDFSGTTDKLTHYVETYTNNTLNLATIEPAIDGTYDFGPAWTTELAGSTWRIDFSADGDNGRDGEVLCSFTVTYASIVVESGPGSNGQAKSTLAKSGPGANRDSVLSKDPLDRGNKPTR